jgi:hypothetical protein
MKNIFEVTMKTTTVMILAAMSVGALASPVMAQSWPNINNVPVSENNALWGVESAPPHEHAYGSTARAHTGRVARQPEAAAASQGRVIDCVHVTFPQCSGE